jgi:transcriptional antiterminator RfaH
MASSALKRNGYDVFFPRILKLRPGLGRTDRPMFPGYLFIRGGRNGNGLPPMDNITGVSGWVRFDGIVPAVPNEVVSEIDRRMESINRNDGYWTRYRPGQEVLVTSGAMQSLARVLEEPKSPQSRVRVLLDFMGQLVPAVVPPADIQPPGDSFLGGPPRRTRGRGRWIRGFGPHTVAGM